MFDFDVRSGRDHDPAAAVGLTEIPPSPALGALLRAECSGSVAQIPRRSVLVVDPSAPLMATLRQMAERRSEAALVGSHGVLLGMLSAHDIVQRVLSTSAPELGAIPVCQVMDSAPQTLLEGDSIEYAVRKIWTLGGRPMPVVQPSGALSGLLETQDILAWLCGQPGGTADAQTAREPIWVG